jgi:hypothetical protein
LPHLDPEAAAVHSNYIRPDGKMSAQLGAFLVRTGNQVVLLDAGLGPSEAGCSDGQCGHAEHQKPEMIQADVEEFFRSKGAPEAQVQWFTDMLRVQKLEHGWLEESLSPARGNHRCRAVAPASRPHGLGRPWGPAILPQGENLGA